MVRSPEAKERKKARALAYYYANKESLAESRTIKSKLWYHANKDRVYQRRKSPEGMMLDRAWRSLPKNKIINTQRTRLRNFIRRTGKEVHLRFGCSPDFMREHIEKQFTKGMNWSNHGEWHIDHIMPCAQFDLSNQMHVDICFNWQNLRPLWAKDNLAKSASITHPQLCLPIAA